MAAIPAGAGALLGKRLGKYEVVALLALGGTAEIYLARIAGAAGFEKYVVVKCLHDHLADDVEFEKMFLDEARLAAHLDHSNIVQTFELGKYENRYYMVMEFLAGLSLAMIVRRCGERLPGGRMPVPLALNIVSQACAGLHYAHEKHNNGKALHVVHRDISPQNLVISFEGVVKVVDFGIAKADARETRTRSGTIKGKFAYMSPEQCVANNVDRRTDVFALGVIAHELLTGRRLFKRNSPYETYQAVIECNVEPPSQAQREVDASLDPIIMRAVAKDKEGRYPTAEAFGDALQSYLHHRGKGSGPSDVGRFIDSTFAIEIDEHGQRMRELISGRTVDPGGWEDDDDDDKARKAAAARQDSEVSDAGGGERSSADSITGLRGAGAAGIDDDDDDGPTHRPDDDDLPADRTRIETNPLERISASELSAPTAPAKAVAPMTPAPLPPTPTPGTGASPAMRPRFQAANIPTMIAEPEPDSPPELAATAINGPLDRPSGPRTSRPMPAVPPRATGEAAAANPPGNGRTSRPQPTNGPASGPRAAMRGPSQAMAPNSEMPTMAHTPAAVQAAMQMAPPMQNQNAQNQLAQNQLGQNQLGQNQLGQNQLGQNQVGQNQPAPRPANVYDTVAVDSGAAGPPMSYPVAPMPGRYDMRQPHDPPSRLATPVEGYPPLAHTDAAVLPVRVVPAWMLALLFAVSLGVALGITFAIAALIRS